MGGMGWLGWERFDGGESWERSSHHREEGGILGVSGGGKALERGFKENKKERLLGLVWILPCWLLLLLCRDFNLRPSKSESWEIFLMSDFDKRTDF